MKIYIINTKEVSPFLFRLIEALDVRCATSIFIKEYYQEFGKKIFSNNVRIRTYPKKRPAYEDVLLRRSTNYVLKKHSYSINKKHDKNNL